MADFNNLSLTTSGIKALVAAQAGTTLKLSKIGLGSGLVTDGSAGLTNLVSQKILLPISEKKINEESGHITIVAKMTNENIEEGFYWRETGLFYEDANGNDVLFAYACVSSEYDYIPAYSDQRYIKHIRIANIITDSADIMIKEEEGLLYVDTLTFEEFKVNVEEHISDTNNPHKVTASDVGLGNVPNVSTNDQTPTYSAASTLATLVSGEKLSVSMGKIMKAITEFISHIGNKKNPHGVTASDVGLGNVDNTSDNNKPVSKAQSEAIGAVQNSVDTHTSNSSNPHSVTKSQVGLGNVPNVSTNDQTPTYSAASTLATLVSGEKLSVSMGKIMKAITEFISHIGNKSNPHGVTKSQIGLGNAENKSSATIRGEITSDNVATALGYTPLSNTLKGAANGLAELDSTGKVPSSQLPAFVDDVLEYTAKASFPASGETGKIYVDTTTNKTYRWSGSTYIEISASLALGETSSTAYRGDYGKVAYEHSQKKSGNPHGVTASDVGLGNVPNVSTNDQTPTYSAASTLATLVSGEKLSVSMGKIMKAITDLISHIGNKSNPHSVTKSQVGLGNVPNVSTNDQTPTYSAASTLATLVSGEKLSVSMGKIMKAITEFISHIGNKSNPHGVTADQIQAVPKTIGLSTNKFQVVMGDHALLNTEYDSSVPVIPDVVSNFCHYIVFDESEQSIINVFSVPTDYSNNIYSYNRGKGNWVKYIGNCDIVDNLLSDATNLPPSARQVKVLKEQLDEQYTKIGNYVYGSATYGEKFGGGKATYLIKNKMCFVIMEATPTSDVANNDILLSGLPAPITALYTSVSTANGNYSVLLNDNGELKIYYPQYTTAKRIDSTIVYPVP